ncbi:hypothetical protein D1872_309980 [compost metagenome]
MRTNTITLDVNSGRSKVTNPIKTNTMPDKRLYLTQSLLEDKVYPIRKPKRRLRGILLANK